MQSGYALCTPDSLKVLCLTKNPTKIELLDIKKADNLNRALCIDDLTTIKSIYDRFKERDLVPDLDIVNVAKLYKGCY